MIRGRLLCCLVVLSALLTSAAAFAQEKKRVAVMDFEGGGGAAVRRHVVAALAQRDEVELVPKGKVEAAARELGVNVDEPSGLQEVSSELSLDALIEGRVQPGKKKSATAVVSVRSGATGERLHREPWTRRNRAKLRDIRGNFWQVMGSFILSSEAYERPKPPKEPEPEPVVEARPEPIRKEVEVPEPEHDGEQRRALLLAVGPRLMIRKLTYENDPGSLSGYRNAQTPGFNVAFAAQWYPMAHLRNDMTADVGLELNGDLTLGLESDEGGSKRDTTAYELLGGLVYRLNLEALGGFEPQLHLGYLLQTFDVDVQVEPLPKVSYSGVRLGLAALVHVYGPISFDVGAAYVHVLDAGDFSDPAIFRSSSGRALEASAGLACGIGDAFGLRASIDYRHFVLDLEEAPGQTFGVPNTPLPEGVTDGYLRATIAFQYFMDGVSP